MVVFKDDPEKYNSPDAYNKIQKDMVKVMELNKIIMKMDEDISLKPMVSSFFLLKNDFVTQFQIFSLSKSPVVIRLMKK